MQIPENQIIVIFGASGDLTKRKIMPSLFNLFCADRLPEKYAVLGLGTSKFTNDTFREKMKECIQTFAKSDAPYADKLTEFLKHIYYSPLDFTVSGNYGELKKQLISLDKEIGANSNIIYYLATAPQLFEPIAINLGLQGLSHQDDNLGWKRIVIEKPFGYDLDSARLLNQSLQKIFGEEQIYRIDHYLGKETVQNILAFRFANGVFEPLWNRNYIDHVEVTASESIGIENRGRYYDNAGALRDMIQNHLLQLVATIAMEPPSRFESDEIRNEKAKIFHSLRPITVQNIDQQVVRGQYLASTIRGENVVGYRNESNVAADSKTETFVAMKLFVDNWRWGGIPFYIRTGKRLPTRVTEAVIHFKRTPHYMFTQHGASEGVENQLVLRIQPDEGVLLKIGMKLPGVGYEIKTVNMDFHYSDLGEFNLPDAYERLLLDCMLGDSTLYARADAVEACWAFLTPILEAWKNNPGLKLYGYPSGTWGPMEAIALFDHAGQDWRYPCKNLSDDGEYCEL